MAIDPFGTTSVPRFSGRRRSITPSGRRVFRGAQPQAPTPPNRRLRRQRFFKDPGEIEPSVLPPSFGFRPGAQFGDQVGATPGFALPPVPTFNPFEGVRPAGPPLSAFRPQLGPPQLQPLTEGSGIPVGPFLPGSQAGQVFGPDATLPGIPQNQTAFPKGIPKSPALAPSLGRRGRQELRSVYDPLPGGYAAPPGAGFGGGGGGGFSYPVFGGGGGGGFGGSRGGVRPRSTELPRWFQQLLSWNI